MHLRTPMGETLSKEIAIQVQNWSHRRLLMVAVFWVVGSQRHWGCPLLEYSAAVRKDGLDVHIAMWIGLTKCGVETVRHGDL